MCSLWAGAGNHTTGKQASGSEHLQHALRGRALCVCKPSIAAGGRRRPSPHRSRQRWAAPGAMGPAGNAAAPAGSGT